MAREHGDRWTCGRCGRAEFVERGDERHEARPPGWRKMWLRMVPHDDSAPGDPPREDSTVKDLCGPCVKIVHDVWDGADRVEIRKKAG